MCVCVCVRVCVCVCVCVCVRARACEVPYMVVEKHDRFFRMFHILCRKLLKNMAGFSGFFRVSNE